MRANVSRAVTGGNVDADTNQRMTDSSSEDRSRCERNSKQTHKEGQPLSAYGNPQRRAFRLVSCYSTPQSFLAFLHTFAVFAVTLHSLRSPLVESPVSRCY
jgi:hypothetical protein